MATTHADFTEYKKRLRARRYLGHYDDGNVWIEMLRTFYFHVRLFLLAGTAVATTVGLYSKERMGMFDGSLIFLPLNIAAFSMSLIGYIKHSEHVNLINSMNRSFLEHNAPWMVQTREKITVRAYKVLNFVITWDGMNAANYALGSIMADTVLHYGFDWLEKPLFVPGAFTPFLPDDVTWDATYYIILSASLWFLWELVAIQHGFVIGYVRMSVSYLTEVAIFKEKVKDLKLEESQDEVDKQFRDIISTHIELLS